jgi:Fe-Mn family superoxide dismutase
MNKYTLPSFPYSYNALEPYIDAKTMEIHHDKHHGAYVAKLNAALDKYPRLFEIPIETLLANLSSVPEDIRSDVRNNGGGHYNHSMFWMIMGKDMGGAPVGDLSKAILNRFGTFETFNSFLKNQYITE